VKNVQVRAGYVLHIGTVEGTLRIGDQVKCCIDEVIPFPFWYCVRKPRYNYSISYYRSFCLFVRAFKITFLLVVIWSSIYCGIWAYDVIPALPWNVSYPVILLLLALWWILWKS